MFYVVKKSQLILALLLVVTVIAAVFLSFLPKDKNTAVCTDYLKELGYSPEKAPYEIAEVSVPEGFGKVYENYNMLQNAAGYDLTPLRGKTIKRYSFRLKGSSYLIANILISEGKICGGDILDPSLSGKILPLIPKEKE